MSYDLFFTEPEITLEQFSEHFSARDHYKVQNTQAWYENEDTGVYFCFDYSNESGEEPEAPSGHVSFNMNFYRPHFFALEAEPEVQSVVAHFGFKILDPQNHMDDGSYSRDGFLAGWNHGNEFGYQAFLSSEEPPEVVHSRPGNELEAIWRWNYTKEDTQNKLGDTVFVPSIMFVWIDGSLKSVVVWGDAIPILIPQVDSLVIPRQELAPRRLFKQKDDLCVIPFSEASHLLKPFESDEYSMPAYFLSYAQPPGEITAFVRALQPARNDMDGIGMDEVLNRELVEQYRKG